MPTSAPGSSHRSGRTTARGFTILELLVVLTIVALAVGVITFTIRDPAQTRLEHEAARLVSLLETARTEARTGGFDVLWVPAGEGAEGEGFRFVGLPAATALPVRWLEPRVVAQVVGGKALLLGPDAILPPQRVVLHLDDQRLEIGSDGLSAFAVLTAEP